MKSNLIKYSFTVFILVALASCATRKEMAVFGNDPDAIQFDVWDSKEDNPLFLNEVNISCESGTISYERDDSGWKPCGNAYFRWGERTSELTFSFVYPAIPNADYTYFYVPTNQSTILDFASADYCRGRVKNPVRGSDGKIAVVLDHAMAKVKININGLPEGESVYAFKMGSYTGLMNTSSTRTTSCEITPLCNVPDGGIKGGNGCSYEAYVCPGGASTKIILFSYYYKGVEYSRTGFPKRVGGHTYEYQLTVNPDGYSISDPVDSQ